MKGVIEEPPISTGPLCILSQSCIRLLNNLALLWLEAHVSLWRIQDPSLHIFPSFPMERSIIIGCSSLMVLILTTYSEIQKLGKKISIEAKCPFVLLFHVARVMIRPDLQILLSRKPVRAEGQRAVPELQPREP